MIQDGHLTNAEAYMVRLNLEDINGLIDNKIEESPILDYKKELTSNKEIAKDVSAFANTSGGKIIYGVDEINDNGIPTSINWIDSKRVIERIEQVILTHIKPEIRGYDIYSIENPENPSQAIFIVDSPESSDAPHMVEVDNYRYYIRRKRISEPMVDSEVKNAIFRKGLRKALEFEISQNLDLANKTSKRLEKYINSHKRVPILLVPFYNEAWRAIISSGILFILKDRAKTLIETYSKIHEINYLIESLKYDKYGYEEGVYTQVDDAKPEYGIWAPSLIRDEIVKLQGILQRIKLD